MFRVLFEVEQLLNRELDLVFENSGEKSRKLVLYMVNNRWEINIGEGSP